MQLQCARGSLIHFFYKGAKLRTAHQRRDSGSMKMNAARTNFVTFGAAFFPVRGFFSKESDFAHPWLIRASNFLHVGSHTHISVRPADTTGFGPSSSSQGTDNGCYGGDMGRGNNLDNKSIILIIKGIILIIKGIIWIIKGEF